MKLRYWIKVRASARLASTMFVALFFLMTSAIASAGEMVQINGRVKGTGTDPNAVVIINAKMWGAFSRMKMEFKGLAPNTFYALSVDGVAKAPLSTSARGRAKIRMSSEGGDIPLDFKPSGAVIAVVDSLSNEALVIDLSEAGPPDGIYLREQTHLAPYPVVPPDGDARARYRAMRKDRAKFDIRLQNVPVGDYELWVEDVFRGMISVATDPEDPAMTSGMVKFDTKPEASMLPFDFEPRNRLIEIRQGEEVFFSGIMSAAVALAP